MCTALCYVCVCVSSHRVCSVQQVWPVPADRTSSCVKTMVISASPAFCSAMETMTVGTALTRNIVVSTQLVSNTFLCSNSKLRHLFTTTNSDLCKCLCEKLMSNVTFLLN